MRSRYTEKMKDRLGVSNFVACLDHRTEFVILQGDDSADCDVAVHRRFDLDQSWIAKLRQLKPPVPIWGPHHNDVDLNTFEPVDAVHPASWSQWMTDGRDEHDIDLLFPGQFCTNHAAATPSRRD